MAYHRCARIADGMTLRAFTRFGAAAVPKHKAFHRASMLLRPATVRVLTRRAQRLLEEVPELPERLFDRTRAARQVRQEPKYRELLIIALQALTNVRAMAKAARALVPRLEFEVGLRAQALCEEITHYAALGDRVVGRPGGGCSNKKPCRPTRSCIRSSRRMPI